MQQDIIHNMDPLSQIDNGEMTQMFGTLIHLKETCHMVILEMLIRLSTMKRTLMEYCLRILLFAMN